MRLYISISVVSIFVLVFLNSCQKEQFDNSSSAKLSFSSDTVTFDTIFSEIGSVTKRFKIYNRNKSSVKINELYLKGGNASNYRINVDGQSGTTFNGIEIRPKDSIYVFVEVTLDPNGGNLPMVVEDEVVVVSNGNSNSVVLESFGQDVHLVKSLETAQTWENDKPYLILKGLIVDTNEVLTINEGVRVYFHDNALLYVWGRLTVNGTLENPVTFEGDRFDGGYDRTAGRWYTIYFGPQSKGNLINYAVIKNPIVGIYLGKPDVVNDMPELTLANTIIQNSSSAHILSYGAKLTAYNCIFADSKSYSLALLQGGEYNFYHCTSSVTGAFRVDAGVFGNYQREPSSYGIVLKNWETGYYYDENEDVAEVLLNRPLVKANFYNSLFWGVNKQELILSNNGETSFEYYFDHCIIRQPEDSLDINDANHYNNLILNEYPNFINDNANDGDIDLRLDTLSPAKDVGNINIVNENAFLEYDLAGKSRTYDGKPDLGAYEREE